MAAVCFSVVCCQVEVSPRANHSPNRVLPIVVRICVIWKSRE
jgi:hypothetical protein